MCGRFGNPVTAEELGEVVQAAENLALAKGWRGGRYNCAPTQLLPVVLPLEGGARRLDLMAWGWKPDWMRSGLLVNARGEEASAKRTFAAALRLRRCLVPMTAFYEWRESDKQPFAFARPDRAPFVVGALWDPVGTAQREPGFLLLTVPANRAVAPVHHRMPLILPRLHWERWLDAATPALEVDALIAPADDGEVEPWPVARAVSRVANDGPELLRPMAAEP